jgi:hypothetical protein
MVNENIVNYLKNIKKDRYYNTFNKDKNIDIIIENIKY